MTTRVYTTMSWDDGHPADLRVAELLEKYGLRATFYVPRTAPGGTMTAAQVRDLSGSFEIGAHSLQHLVLTTLTEQQAAVQITGSKSWVEHTTGVACPMFCAPQGKFSRRHLEIARSAGYLGFRTVELSSLDFPSWQSGVLVMPTTVQAYQHSPLALARNAIKRMAPANLWRALIHGSSREWSRTAKSFLRHAVSFGGVFHLWGHSWELEGAPQWRQLEQTFRLLKEAAELAPPVTNGQLCLQSLVRMIPDARAIQRAQVRGAEQ
jgi:peptidoglycan-N-acetylglucosamine deacetylase